MIKYYAFFDTDLQLYNPPFSAADDRSAIRITRNMLLSADDAVLSKVVPITELCYIGTFDEQNGIFSNCINGVRTVISLSEIPLPIKEESDA